MKKKKRILSKNKKEICTYWCYLWDVFPLFRSRQLEWWQEMRGEIIITIISNARFPTTFPLLFFNSNMQMISNKPFYYCESTYWERYFQVHRDKPPSFHWTLQAKISRLYILYVIPYFFLAPTLSHYWKLLLCFALFVLDVTTRDVASLCEISCIILAPVKCRGDFFNTWKRNENMRSQHFLPLAMQISIVQARFHSIQH